LNNVQTVRGFPNGEYQTFLGANLTQPLLKNNGLATEKSKACRHGKLSLSETRHISWHMFHNFYPCSEILTSTIGTKDESKGRLVRKAKVRYDFC